jgi:hypothetical protein
LANALFTDQTLQNKIKAIPLFQMKKSVCLNFKCSKRKYINPTPVCEEMIELLDEESKKDCKVSRKISSFREILQYISNES